MTDQPQLEKTELQLETPTSALQHEITKNPKINNITRQLITDLLSKPEENERRKKEGALFSQITKNQEMGEESQKRIIDFLLNPDGNVQQDVVEKRMASLIRAYAGPISDFSVEALIEGAQRTGMTTVGEEQRPLSEIKKLFQAQIQKDAFDIQQGQIKNPNLESEVLSKFPEEAGIRLAAKRVIENQIAIRNISRL